MKKCLWLVFMAMTSCGNCIVKLKVNHYKVMIPKKKNHKEIIYSNYMLMNDDKRKVEQRKRMNCFIFHMGNLYKTKKKKTFRIFRGCGTTDNYEWVERDDHLEIKIRLPENTSTDDIQYCLKTHYIFIKLKDKSKCLLEGNLKGAVDTTMSTWFLEKLERYNILHVFLKKKQKGINEWVGVVEKESISHLSYDELPANTEYNSSFLKNAKTNELLHSHFFENAKFDEVYALLLKWASKKASSGNEFGIPITKLKTNVMKNDMGIEILISGFDMKWKAEDSIVLKLSSCKKGIMLHIFRGKVASGLLGMHGNVTSMLVKDCEERLIKKLQHDLKGVFYLNPLYEKVEKVMHNLSPEPHYSLATTEGAGENEEDSMKKDSNTGREKDKENGTKPKEHNQNEKKENGQEEEEEEEEEGEGHNQKGNKPKEVLKDSAEEALIVKELQLNSKVKLTCDDKKKEPEFMKNWSEEKKIEFRRNSVLELKQQLELSQEKKITLKIEDYVNHMKALFDLSDEESQLMWKKGFKKSQEQTARKKYYEFTEVEQLTDRIQLYDITIANQQSQQNQKKEQNKNCEQTEGNDSINTTYRISQNMNKNNVNVQFLNILDNDILNPTEEKNKSLYNIYIKSNDEEKKKMRSKWQVNEIRLNTLIEELKYVGDDDSIVPTICNNYRDVLLSEEYSCLMKLRLQEHPPKTVEEKRTLKKVNCFVISLYDDVRIIMEHEEKEHLKKIRLICEKAIEDEKGLNEYIESMKPLLDYSFLAYIKYAIEIEKKNIQLQNKDFRQEPSDWLIILLIIKKGIYSILEKDIWEEVLHITTIICHEQASVRKTLLQTIVASMPKADWIFFKDLINTLYKSVLEKKITANHLPEFPHAIEAIFQLHFDIEQILPDWFIKEMLNEYDKSVIEQLKKKKPIFWKMKETQWDKKFINDLKKKQEEKFHEYASTKRLGNKGKG